jgi:Bacterial PH domain
MIYAAPEHEFEAEKGLPASLPKGEHILWQGSPDAWSLARHAFHVPTLTAYFGGLLTLRALFALGDGQGIAAALGSAVMLLPLALLAVGVVALVAWLAARSAVYTLTNRRLVMRIGIVLNITFNLPLKALNAAAIRLYKDGSGDIPLSIAGDDNIAYPHLWPHAKPWHIKRTQPMLRSVPDAARVGALLASAAANGASLSAAGTVSSNESIQPTKPDETCMAIAA